ncbi:MAG: transcriptional regulator [Bacillota bacterium]
MEFIRIGEKLISRDKIISTVDHALKLRVAGASQQDAAKQLGLDRTFISRLETIGEVRKGGTIALVGFPILNKDEILAMTMEEGVDFTLVMTEQERLDFVRLKSGLELLNELMGLITKVRQFDTTILLGSNNRVRLTSALLDKEVIGIAIGESPLQQDQLVDVDEVRAIIRQLKAS